MCRRKEEQKSDSQPGGSIKANLFNVCKDETLRTENNCSINTSLKEFVFLSLRPYEMRMNLFEKKLMIRAMKVGARHIAKGT